MLDGRSEEVERNLEIAKLCDMLGFEPLEAFAGVNWFMMNCQNSGKLPTILGEKVELNRNGLRS